jgi:hypothetical protein
MSFCSAAASASPISLSRDFTLIAFGVAFFRSKLRRDFLALSPFFDFFASGSDLFMLKSCYLNQLRFFFEFGTNWCQSGIHLGCPNTPGRGRTLTASWAKP